MLLGAFLRVSAPGERRICQAPREPENSEHAVLFFQIAQGCGYIGHGESDAELAARANVVTEVESVVLHAQPAAIGVVSDLARRVLDGVLAVIVDGFGAGVQAPMVGIAEAIYDY